MDVIWAKPAPSILIIFKWTIKSTKKHTEYVTFFYSLDIFQNIWYVLSIFVQIGPTIQNWNMQNEIY